MSNVHTPLTKREIIAQITARRRYTQWTKKTGGKVQSMIRILELLPETPTALILAQAMKELVTGVIPTYPTSGYVWMEKVYLLVLQAFFQSEDVLFAPRTGDNPALPKSMTSYERVFAYLLMQLAARGPDAVSNTVQLSLIDQLVTPQAVPSYAEQMDGLLDHLATTYEQGPITVSPEIESSLPHTPIQAIYNLALGITPQGSETQDSGSMIEEWDNDIVPFKAE